MMSIVQTPLIIALVVIGLFFIIFTILEKKEMLKRYNLEMSGLFLIWKTERGKKFIESISQKKRFWTAYGNISIMVITVSMVIILVLLAWSAYLASFIPAESAPSPRMVIGIPGVNPLIPVWYGILGLAVAIIVHEFSHGILARLADVKVKTLGLVFVVVPIGAFVEPDEEEMEALPNIKRDRIYGAGPTANIIFALVFVLLFSSVFMASISPREDGLLVHGMVRGSQADLSDMGIGELVLSIDGNRVSSHEDIDSIDIPPMDDVTVRTRYGDSEREHTVVSGLTIVSVLPDYPADDAGLRASDIIISIDDDYIRNYDDFNSVIQQRSSGDTVNITYSRHRDGDYITQMATVVLLDKYESFQELYPHENKDEYRGQPYMGVTISYMGISFRDVGWIRQLMVNPYTGADSFNDYVMASLTYISFPFLGLSPIPMEIAQLYEITGPLSVIPESLFWTMANSFYWIFWLNLMVGLFNSLPAVPLDGGYVFKDGLSWLVEKFGMKESTENKLVHGLSYFMAFLILGMLLWQLIGPRI